MMFYSHDYRLFAVKNVAGDLEVSNILLHTNKHTSRFVNCARNPKKLSCLTINADFLFPDKSTYTARLRETDRNCCPSQALTIRTPIHYNIHLAIHYK
jgi:hypothetical protein